MHFLAISLTSSEVGGSPVTVRRGNASAALWRPRSLPHEPRDTGSPSSRRCRAPDSPLHPTAPTAEASAAARIFGEEQSLLRVPATSRCRTMPSTAAAPAQPRLYGRSGTGPAALCCGAARKDATPRDTPLPLPRWPHSSRPPREPEPAARRRSARGQQRAGEVPEVPARPRASCHSPFEMLDDLLFPHVLW